MFLAGALLIVALMGALVLPRVLGGAAGGSRTSGAAAPQDRPGPVLLVPGYGGGTDSLRQLAARLEAAGRQARVVPAVGDGTGDLRVQADALDQEIDRALEAGAPSVDLVGYSAGGVVVRLWVAQHDGEHKARRIVTLGAPHHGSEVATTAAALFPSSCPAACQALSRDSELLVSLNRGDETPDGPRWTSLYTAADSIVTPPDSARLDGAVNVALQEVCTGARVEHGELPTDPLPVGLVLRALGPGLDAAPPAQECTTLRALGDRT